MSFLAFILIVFSAVLHASWNLLGKRSTMSISFYTAMCITACMVWLHVQFWTPVNIFRLPGEFFLFLILSVVSDICYCLGLVRAYRTMEMSTAYPMMRALPILLTALVTSLLGWGSALSPLAIAGMAVVFLGCMMMPLKDFSHFKFKDYLNRNLLFIVLVACGTTGYTILDKEAQNVFAVSCQDLNKITLSLTYYSTRSVTLTSALMLLVLIWPGELKTFKNLLRQNWKMPLLAGLSASMTYTTVLLAMNYVDNASYVQVFRQLGLIFGMAGSILILKERCTWPKVIGVLLILSGLAMTVIKL